MDSNSMKEKLSPHLEVSRLDRYTFLWSEARLVIASVALFLGGVPPLWFLVSGMPALFWLIRPILTLSWIISGAVSVYLVYRWNQSGQKVFGGNAKYDVWAFWVNVVTGFNLGIAGLFGRNIGMTLAPFYGIFILTGLVYLATAAYLYSRWNKSGQKLF
jgi:hypothetical protein